MNTFIRFIDRPLRKIIERNSFPGQRGPVGGQHTWCKLGPCGHIVRRKASDAARIHRTRCEHCLPEPLEN